MDNVITFPSKPKVEYRTEPPTKELVDRLLCGSGLDAWVLILVTTDGDCSYAYDNLSQIEMLGAMDIVKHTEMNVEQD